MSFGGKKRGYGHRFGRGCERWKAAKKNRVSSISLCFFLLVSRYSFGKDFTLMAWRNIRKFYHEDSWRYLKNCTWKSYWAVGFCEIWHPKTEGSTSINNRGQTFGFLLGRYTWAMEPREKPGVVPIVAFCFQSDLKLLDHPCETGFGGSRISSTPRPSWKSFLNSSWTCIPRWLASLFGGCQCLFGFASRTCQVPWPFDEIIVFFWDIGGWKRKFILRFQDSKLLLSLYMMICQYKWYRSF